MPYEQTRTVPQRGAMTLLDLVEQLARYQGPPEQFIVQLLAMQCHIAPAQAAAVIRAGQGSNGHAAPPQLLAVYPPLKDGQTAPVWLASAVEHTPEVVSLRCTQAYPIRKGDELYGQKPREHLVMLPLHGPTGVRGVVGYLVAAPEGPALALAQERLELTVGLLNLYEMRLTVQQRGAELRRLQRSLQVLSAANEHSRFKAAALAVCNEVASQWGAHRVALGMVQGRYVRMQAISHTDKFTRKMRLVQDLEAAMEECADQDLEVLVPPAPDAVCVSRAAGLLVERHGPAAVCCLPLRRDRQVLGVLTVERPADQPLSAADVELLRLTADLVTARLAERHEADRWIGARLLSAARRGLAVLLGPRYTWVKAAAAAVFAAILLLTLVEGPDRVKADFAIQPIQRQIIPAPFDGYLHEVFVEPGTNVIARSTVLATLDTSELKQQLDQAQQQYEGFLREADIAMRDGKPTDVEVARLKAEQILPAIAQLRWRIEQAAIRCPIDGVVTQGDLKRQIGAPVSKGDVLFEVAPVQALRAELKVDESRIQDVAVGQTGQLAAASHPGDYLNFVVERINPVAELEDRYNVFKVRVRLEESRPWLKPGMEGVAKVDVGRRPYGYLWTRELVNWLRMKLWI